MGKKTGFIVVSLLVFIIINYMPTAGSQDSNIEWFEEYSVIGNCGSSDNVEHRFWVNRTVVEIEINVSWSQGYGVDINFWLEDSLGFHVDASDSEDNPDTLDIRKFPDRGRWKLVIYLKSCGSGTEVNYTANITVRHIVLPELTISKSGIDEGEEVTMNITSSYPNITQYFIDFGDSTDSGWDVLSSHSKTYNGSGYYTPKVKVRYSDGTESDWVEGGEIEVKAIPPVFPWVAFWLIFISIIIFLISLRYDKKRGF